MCKKYNIPTAKFGIFKNFKSAINFLDSSVFPIVIKADGLAAGKGVVVSSTAEETYKAIDDLLASNHSDHIVIEEFLTGQELSAIYVCNFKGCSFEIALPWTKDYKSRDEYNNGPNTGGMGAVSHPLCYEHKNTVFKLHIDIEKIMIKTIASINTYNKNVNNGYLGFLYIGLMIDSHNNIKVLEYNCRLGDPETQNLMLTLENKNIDLIDLIINQPINNIKDILNNWNSFVKADGHSDYQRSFDELILNKKIVNSSTNSLLVIGDARNNYRSISEETISKLSKSFDNIYWMNPERKQYWNTGDSRFMDFQKVCESYSEVRNFNQLKNFIENINFKKVIK